MSNIASVHAREMGERVAKYNQLMRIEEELGTSATHAARSPFGAGRGAGRA